MKKAAYFWLLLFFPVFLTAQGFLRTITPTEPVVAGEAFRVQYIIEDESKAGQFINPDFKSLQLITGPAIYKSESSSQPGFKQSKNYVFTLLAAYPGKYPIPGALIYVDGKKLKWSDSFVEVKFKNSNTSGPNSESNFSDYSLRPGENAIEKIRKNIFIKVFVDKKDCYTGEPVLAVFKLYSSLESQSDIVKNPGFYGFTVYDMINLQDKLVNSEVVNGVNFNVHTIRKVQLFPLQPGRFYIDDMEVKNRVTFSRNSSNKNIEQAITEGNPGGNDDAVAEVGTEVYETDLKTETVEINVRPVAEKNKPKTFNGAVGSFSISASVGDNVLAKNEEGLLEIIIRGKGNFLQLSSPLVQWPAGIEVFEPSVKDTFDKTKMPLEGSRVFRYAFVSSKPGSFSMPAINFSFFNPDSGTYKTIATNSMQINVTEQEKSITGISLLNNPVNKKASAYYWLLGGMLLAAGVYFYLFFKRKNKEVVKPISNKNEEKPKLIVDELMAPVYLQQQAEGKLYFTSLNKVIWDFFTRHYNYSGSEITKDNLLITMKRNGVDKNDRDFIRAVLEECEIGMFTNTNILKDRNKILDSVKEILSRINR